MSDALEIIFNAAEQESSHLRTGVKWWLFDDGEERRKRCAKIADEIEAALHEVSGRCYARISHGPGHQSRSKCDLTGEHEIHECAPTGDVLRWREHEGMTGCFDESPEEEGDD